MPTNLSTQPVWMDGSQYEKIILGRANIQLSPKWILTSGSGFSNENSANPAYCPVLILDYAGTTLCEQINQATRDYHYSNDVGIRGKFNTGSFSHSFMVDGIVSSRRAILGPSTTLDHHNLMTFTFLIGPLHRTSSFLSCLRTSL